MSDEIPLNQNTGKKALWQSTKFLLLCIILLAASLRVINPGKSPPGLNQDEAANIWNAYCLLKTGKDQTGTSWPIFYMHGLGHNRTPLYIYALLPFLAVGGLSIRAARMLSAAGGIICIPIIYYIGRQLFNKKVGLIAAALLAVNPWHLFMTRWSHEASISPLVGIVPLALMLWAGMPIADNTSEKPKPIRAALAGVITGICCYAYWCVPIFVLLLLALAVLLTLPKWLKCLKSRQGKLSVILFISALFLTFGPLMWQYLFHTQDIAHHSTSVLFWARSRSFPAVLKNIASIYIKYFGPDFLFIRGDHFELQSPPGIGQFHWYMLPLMLSGLIFVLRKLRTSTAARLLLAMVILYPVAGSIGTAISPHALRSSPGLCPLVLLAAAGAAALSPWLNKTGSVVKAAVISLFIIAAVGINIRYLYRFYGEYNTQTSTFLLYDTDFVEACEWLKGRLENFEAVFCTTEGIVMPYIISLVTLKYEPDKWLTEPKQYFTSDEFEHYKQYGKMYFIYDYSFLPTLEKLKQKPVRKPILFIIRPGQLNLPNPVHKISTPSGTETLWLCVI